jgi:transposase-like protein
MHSPDLAARREQARLLYVETDLTIVEIARRLGVARGSISAWAHRYDWPRRSPNHYSRVPDGQSTAPAASSSDTMNAAASSIATKDATAAASAPAPLQGLPKQSLPEQSQPKQHRPNRRLKRPPIKSIVDRLYHIINHNLELMETRMSDDGQPTDANNPERDMRAISSVVRSVDKLKEIEPEQSKRHNASSGAAGYPLITAEEEDRIRRKVVEHILKLRERKRGDGSDSSSD